ncbi:hypothetical protein PoB_001516500 [Plakobranchus ocellatus]|uniref:Uncharacterized protein n=1 Tax=Plakobranchus ocellatus TaxID=259542 RepID=A0AAV3Z1Y1_9GAST|nr:hypothetical protein PoB_001516500 [Plakobranchus ocellatus]
MSNFPRDCNSQTQLEYDSLSNFTPVQMQSLKMDLEHLEFDSDECFDYSSNEYEICSESEDSSDEANLDLPPVTNNVESSSGAQFNNIFIDFNITESFRGQNNPRKKHDVRLTRQDVYNIKHRSLGTQGGRHNDIEKCCDVIDTLDLEGGAVCVGKDDCGGFEF